MVKSKVYLLLLIAVLCIAIPDRAKAQTCPEEEGCLSPWSTNINVTMAIFPSCTLNAQYRWRNCSGRIQFDVVSMSYSGVGCAGSMNDRAILDRLILYIIANSSQIPSGFAVLPCPNNTTMVEVVSASCYFAKQCTTTYNDIVKIECNYGLPFPENQDNIKVVTELLPCGTNCCIREYTVCNDGMGHMKLTNKGVRTPNGTCSNPNGAFGPFPGGAGACQVVCDTY